MLNRVFNFNGCREAKKVVRSIAPHARFSEDEIQQSLLVFSSTMRGMASGMKNVSIGFAIAAAAMTAVAAGDGRVVPAGAGVAATLATGIFARRKGQQQVFYTNLHEVAVSQGLRGARQHLHTIANALPRQVNP